jgi:CRP-like cAMP-binding protein
MSPGDYARLRPDLVSVELSRAEPLVESDQPLLLSWFLEHGIASVVATTPTGHQTEVGIIGRDGVVEVATLFGADRAAHRCFIQLAGSGYRLPANALQAACENSASLRQLLLGYAYSFMAQVAGTALANASYSIDERLARWLLMCHDRIDGDDIATTHEFLALMLNVRRAGVTVTIQALENAGLVKARRGTITIVDRSGLEQWAADSYGAPEAVFARLIG